MSETVRSADEAIAAFADTGGLLPRAAMRWALDHWDEAAPRFLRFLDGYVAEPDLADLAKAVFIIVHLMGEKAERRAFRPLCRLMREDAEIEHTLGDAVGETLPHILISTFDGDLGSLKAVIADDAADEFARGAALRALAYLTRTGAQSDKAMRADLVAWHDAFPRDPEFSVWAEWILAVAHLGYADLAPRAEALLRKDIPTNLMTLEDFREELRRTRGDPTSLAGFEHDGLGPFKDAIGTIEALFELSGDATADEDDDLIESDEASEENEGTEPAESYVNPLRNVGRNDPCPCGSGKKYKKCCLGKPPA